MHGLNEDPYLYPGTAVLKNLLDIRDAEALKLIESDLTYARQIELARVPVRGDFDADHLKAIHHQIFQDVYQWAGEFRTTSLEKQEYVGGPVHTFTPPHQIESDLTRIHSDLRQADYLRDLRRAAFAERAAKVLADLNQAHPFREGNGRSQRALITQLGREAGHELNFGVVSRERMIQASIEATKGDLAMMNRLIKDISDPDHVQSLTRAINFFQQHRFDWNDIYIATAAPGQTYTGRMVGREAGDFMIRTDDHQIIIGKQQDIPLALTTGQRLSFTAGEGQQRSLERDVGEGLGL